MALVQCENCKHNYSDKAKKCPFCGNKSGKAPNREGKRRTVKSKTILASVLAISIFIAMLVLFTSLYADQTKKFYRHVAKGEYEEAWQYVESNLSDDEKAKTEIAKEMAGRIQECEERYISEQASMEETLKELDNFSKILLVQQEVEEAKARVNELGGSRENYTAAKGMEEAGDYMGAMEKYNLVVERDSNYQVARERYEACFQIVKADAMQKAEEFRVQKAYNEAVSVLEACQALKEDEEVGQTLAAILEEKTNYENELAEQARLASEQEKEARKNYLAGLIKVIRVSCEKPNSEGGVNLFVNFKNMSDRKMQSVVFRVVPVNAAGEALTCKKSGTSSFGAWIKGPFRKGDGLLDQNRYWPNAWYNKSIKGVVLESVEVEFGNGKKEVITNEEIPYIYN